MIESTAPTEGVFTPDQRFQKALLNSLLASKLITKEEILANGEQVVFANAILPDVKIDIRQLAGLQYRNDALQAVQSTNWGAANKQYLKSYLLYADPAVMTMIAITGILNLSLGNIVGIDRIKESIFILENCPKMIARERLHLMLEEEVEVYANAHYGENDWNQLQILLDPYHDDTLIYEQAQYRILGQRYDAAQRNKEYDKCAGMAKELYKIKPWSPQVQSCLIDNFLHHFKGNNDFQAVLDSMDRFAIKYPFAPTDDSFHTAYMMFLLGIAGGKFESDECKKAEISIQRFEAFQSQKAGTDISEIIGGAYAAGVRAYFRIPDYKNARRCLERGMALAPYSRDISSCKRSFGKELGLDPE